MANTSTKHEEFDNDPVFRKNYAIIVTALSIIADEINSFSDPEALREYLLKERSRPKEELEREAEAIVAQAKKLVNNPV